MHKKYPGLVFPVYTQLYLLVLLIQPSQSQSNMSSPSNANPCKIYLRHDQSAKDFESHSNPNVSIYAPTWVEEGLKKLGSQLRGTSFAVLEKEWGDRPLQTFTIMTNLSLKELHKISRNEELNVSGIINWSQYTEGGVNDTQVLLAMKDLVRQSIIVGRDTSTHYGGYPTVSSRTQIKPLPIPVYVCDLAALQFQKNYNSGRLVLIYESNQSAETIGILDNFIFERVVGEKKKSYDEAKKEAGTRYISTRSFHNKPCLFDIYAYHKFVAGDVVLAGLAVAKMASNHGDQIVFKFLKYGTGFFAGQFVSETSSNILEGVIIGLEILFSQHGNVVLGTIKHVEFPYYPMDSGCRTRLETIKDKYNVSYSFSYDDALKPTQQGLVVATTNCGDSMAVIGNEMGFSSVDAEIAENLKSKGNIFCPILNPEMGEMFIDISK